MKARILFVFGICLVMSSMASAENLKKQMVPTDFGNGGWGLYCDRNTGKIDLYDFKKFGHKYKPSIQAAGGTVEAKVDLLVERVGKYSPSTADVLSEYAKHFFNSVEYYSDRVFETIDDKGDSFSFDKCDPLMIARQGEPELLSESYYEIVKKYYDRLQNNDHRAGLVFHEIVFRFAREKGNWKTSKAVHPFVALMASWKMASGKVSQEEFLKHLVDLYKNDNNINKTYRLEKYSNHSGVSLYLNDWHILLEKQRKGVIEKYEILSGNYKICGTKVDLKNAKVYIFKNEMESWFTIPFKNLHKKTFKCPTSEITFEKMNEYDVYFKLDTKGNILQIGDNQNGVSISGWAMLNNKKVTLSNQKRKYVVGFIEKSDGLQLRADQATISFNDNYDIKTLNLNEDLEWEVNGEKVVIDSVHQAHFHEGGKLGVFVPKTGAKYESKSGVEYFCKPGKWIMLDENGKLLYEEKVAESAMPWCFTLDDYKRWQEEQKEKEKKQKKENKKKKTRKSKNWE